MWSAPSDPRGRWVAAGEKGRQEVSGTACHEWKMQRVCNGIQLCGELHIGCDLAEPLLKIADAVVDHDCCPGTQVATIGSQKCYR
jgi:hypothetical protein